MGFHIVATGGHEGPLPAELLERRKVLATHCVSASGTIPSCRFLILLY